jgi:sRNA-binding protein
MNTHVDMESGRSAAQIEAEYKAKMKAKKAEEKATKAAARAAAKAEKAATAKPRKSGGKRAAQANVGVIMGKIEPTATITILTAENPKRAGTTAYDHFAMYTNGMTVEAYKAACKNGNACIRWDLERSLIAVSGVTVEAAAPKASEDEGVEYTDEDFAAEDPT